MSKFHWIVAAAVLVFSSGMYLMLGSPEFVFAGAADPHPARHDPASATAGQSVRSVATVASLVDGLGERLEREPDDGGGWLLLARSYEHLGRHADALAAYRRAQQLGKSDIALEASLVGSSLSVQELGPAPGPAIRGRVALSPEAAAMVEPGDTVFIFAKESPDQRMPVVALRRPAADLPVDFVLTDAEVMISGASLADFESLFVTAKISRSGNATDNSGGLEVWSDPVSPFDGDNLDLIIATVDGNHE